MICLENEKEKNVKIGDNDLYGYRSGSKSNRKKMNGSERLNKEKNEKCLEKGDAFGSCLIDASYLHKKDVMDEHHIVDDTIGNIEGICMHFIHFIHFFLYF